LIMAEATYDPFRMILQRYPEFKTQVLDRYGVNLTSFFEFDNSRWEQYPLPIPGDKVLALDFYLSSNGRNEGTGITNDHPKSDHTKWTGLDYRTGPRDARPEYQDPATSVDLLSA